MRKRIISFAAGALTMLLMLLVLSKFHAEIERKEQEPIQAEYISTIEKTDCFMCGTGNSNAGYTYWGEDNVGILNLNT